MLLLNYEIDIHTISINTSNDTKCVWIYKPKQD
jgi:hypothetical protein